MATETEASMKNSKTLPGVACSVTRCAYNDKNGHCTAKQVDIGPTCAKSVTETVCATFKPDSEQAEGRIF